MREVKARIRHGEHFDFVYSENLTIPFAMSEAHRLPLNPLVDHRFLSFCNANRIPVSLFNRDVYWRDTSYTEMLPWWGRMVTIPLHWFDLWWHTRYLHTLYLPSEAMARALPWIRKFKNVRYLPPGAEIYRATPATPATPATQKTNGLKVFYVGGIEPPTYDLRPLLTAIHKAETPVFLTICCRKKEWQKVSDLYNPLLNSQINVVHFSGEELLPLYRESDLFAVVRGAGSYIDFSVPIKIYESIGFALPILCTPGGETARIVETERFGWVRSSGEIANFLDEVAQAPEKIETKREELIEIRKHHTWTARAKQVCENMPDDVK
jgi:glycosyltransferase involved in cell wall biosynthesis